MAVGMARHRGGLSGELVISALTLFNLLCSTLFTVGLVQSFLPTLLWISRAFKGLCGDSHRTWRISCSASSSSISARKAANNTYTQRAREPADSSAQCSIVLLS